MEETPHYRLLGDSPVLETEREDGLDFRSTASALAEAAVETDDPLTIGVFGEWGAGKTSLMRLMEEEIRNGIETRDVVPVWFNAWQYEREEHLIVPLVATINKELGENPAKGSEWKERADKLKAALRAVAFGFSVKGKVGIPLISEAEVNLSGEKMVERYQALAKDSMLDRSLYFNAFAELSGVVQGAPRPPRIVVFVDDLDRCNPGRAVDLLENIKLVLHQPGFVFVLGVHADLVESVIWWKYAKEFHLEDTKYAKDYLHKITQVTVHVPHRDSQGMTSYIESLLDKANVQMEPSDKEIMVPMIAEAANHNPRAVVRTLNGMIITMKIGQKEGNDYRMEALVIEIMTRERDFREFRSSLDVTIPKPEEDEQATQTIGVFLDQALKDLDTTNHADWSQQLLAKTETYDSQSLKDAVRVLKEHENLCNLLKTEAGSRWLTDKDWREGMGRSLERTGSQQEAKPDMEPSDAIEQLLSSMVSIEGGEFTMGSEDGPEREKPLHRVEVSPFEMSSVPVTQAQYEAVMGENPASSPHRAPNKPVVNVSWTDAKRFCERLSSITGTKFRLPTEAEWEYACRAGTATEYSSGDSEADLDRVGWYQKNSGEKLHAVGQKQPNTFGLYDMHGNVFEWVEDDWHDDYKGAPENGESWVDQPRGLLRVSRGGSWNYSARGCRSAYRFSVHPDARAGGLGFRLSRSAP